MKQLYTEHYEIFINALQKDLDFAKAEFAKCQADSNYINKPVNQDVLDFQNTITNGSVEAQYGRGGSMEDMLKIINEANDLLANHKFNLNTASSFVSEVEGYSDGDGSIEIEGVLVQIEVKSHTPKNSIDDISEYRIKLLFKKYLALTIYNKDNQYVINTIDCKMLQLWKDEIIDFDGLKKITTKTNC